MRGILDRRPESKVLLAGVSPVLAAALFDLVVHQFLKDDSVPFLTGPGFAALFVSMLFILAWRFVEYRNKLQTLNATLEQKVHDRTLELEQSNERLGATVADLESARAIAAKDLAMAINVQKNVLEPHPPLSPDWDIAFEFRPMAGISGDFYDFYLEADTLKGVSLFDVSGHGIASGLITMIGRSVLSSQMRRKKHARLDSVVSLANAELIKQIGNTDNYLSGVVLRFAGNQVEYVNAGHPDVLYRRAAKGRVVPVRHKDYDARGRFMGVEALESAYHSLVFRVYDNDILLLASDCLTEARNKAGEEYGTQRLAESLLHAGGTTSQDILDALLADFGAFTSGVPLADDLTIMVVRRRCPGEEMPARQGAPVEHHPEDDMELIIEEA